MLHTSSDSPNIVFGNDLAHGTGSLKLVCLLKCELTHCNRQGHASSRLCCATIFSVMLLSGHVMCLLVLTDVSQSCKCHAEILLQSCLLATINVCVQATSLRHCVC